VNNKVGTPDSAERGGQLDCDHDHHDHDDCDGSLSQSLIAEVNNRVYTALYIEA
jgi:hypothetical protein